MAILKKPKLEKTKDGESYYAMIQKKVWEYDPNWVHESQEFKFVKESLSNSLTPEQSQLLKAYWNAEYLRLSNNLKKIYEWGMDDGYLCLDHPKHRDFIHKGFEEIINEDFLNASIETKLADIAGQRFFSSLPDDAHEDSVYRLIDYISYIETVWYKIAHLLGFRYVVRSVIPYYCPHMEAMTNLYDAYRKIAEEYLGFTIISKK